MPSRWIALAIALLASQKANAACVIHGERPTVPLPTMAAGQEFSFIASPDCETLRFTIRGTTFSKMPKSAEPMGPGPRTYKVRLTESEWDAVVAESGSTLTWVVGGRTSAGVTTRMVTTNDLKTDDTIDLSTADAKLVGEEEDDHAGGSVSGAGDVNADGNDDVLVGAPNNDDGGSSAGAAYLVLGPVTGTFDLSRADAKLVGEGTYNYAGSAVSGAGDVDDDGHDDLLVGTHPSEVWASTDDGTPYLLLGPVTGTLDLSEADAKFVGEDPDDDGVGDFLSGAGDVDGDGRGDLLVGAPGNDEGGDLAGAAYLILGPVTGAVDLSFAAAKLVGEESWDRAGYFVSDAGDTDADGHHDVLVGGTPDQGAVYLVRGPVTGTLELALADAKLVGDEWYDESVSGAGDVDGDGHDDVLIGGTVPRDDYTGAAYLVLGPVTGTLDLTLADATLVGESWGDHAGASVSAAGDVDRDGHHDVLVGAPFEGAAGATYLVRGPVTGTFDLSLADAKFVGESGDAYSGGTVSGAGDVDADGRGDVLVSAWNNSEGGFAAGAVYLLYGGGL
jgi:hypothetical protein